MITELTNEIILSGVVSSQPVHSHSVYNEEFYIFYIRIERLSGAVDILPCIAPYRLIKGVNLGDYIELEGQIRSYNRIEEGKNRLDVRVFVREVMLDEYENELNEGVLTGYVCKPPIYRVTPFNREITDMLLAVNRSFNKSDYIPIITWGKNARLTKELAVGSKLTVTGRLQSREYEKQTEEGIITRTAYELSCCAVKLLN